MYATPTNPSHSLLFLQHPYIPAKYVLDSPLILRILSRYPQPYHLCRLILMKGIMSLDSVKMNSSGIDETLR